MSLNLFPPINAFLNLLAGIFLICGWMAIRRGDKAAHKKFMIYALCASAVFLCCYLTYHVLSPGVTRYQGEGLKRFVYFFILLTHTPLAALIAPFSIAAVVFALKRNLARHTQITKWLLPVWLYVSLTGVIIYLMLYIF